MIRLFSMTVALTASLCLAQFSVAGEFNSVINIGDKAPSFVNLAGVDGKTHGLNDSQEAKAVVVVFTCNQCPVAVAYEDRLIQLQEDYKSKGVQVIAINVSSEGLEKMKARAENKGFNFPYLLDASQKSAREYGATVTPHAFLLDAERNVVYMGAIDNNQNPDRITKRYLRSAIDAVLAGQKPETTETRQFGCGIKLN